MKYKIYKTDVFEEQLSKTILYIANLYGGNIGMKRLDELEKAILSLKDNPYLCIIPKYRSLRRQEYRVLISKQNMIFYKVDEINRIIYLYALFDYRQDYMNIINGL